MITKEALEREIDYLKHYEIQQLRLAEQKGDLMLGSIPRQVLRLQYESLERLLKSEGNDWS